MLAVSPLSSLGFQLSVGQVVVLRPSYVYRFVCIVILYDLLVLECSLRWRIDVPVAGSPIVRLLRRLCQVWADVEANVPIIDAGDTVSDIHFGSQRGPTYPDGAWATCSRTERFVDA